MGLNTMERKGATSGVENRVAVNYEVLNPWEFLDDVAKLAPTASRLVAQTMVFEPDLVWDKWKNIFHSMPKESQKELFIDGYSDVVGYDTVHPFESQLQRFSSFYSTFKRVGVQINLTNPPDRLQRFLPFLGRNHIKGVSIQDAETGMYTFYFGGLNSNHATFNRSDFMVKFTGEEAQILAREFDRLHGKDVEGPEIDITNNFVVPISNDSLLMVDIGKRGSSVILGRATAMVDRAESSIQHTSSFMPDEPMINAENRAHQRGVHIDILTSNPSLKITNPYSIANMEWVSHNKNRIAAVMKARGLTFHINPQRMTHSKLLVVDSGEALFGTHNLWQSSVDAGTVEWSIHTTNEHLIENLSAKFQEFTVEGLGQEFEVI